MCIIAFELVAAGLYSLRRCSGVSALFLFFSFENADERIVFQDNEFINELSISRKVFLTIRRMMLTAAQPECLRPFAGPFCVRAYVPDAGCAERVLLIVRLPYALVAAPQSGIPSVPAAGRSSINTMTGFPFAVPEFPNMATPPGAVLKIGLRRGSVFLFICHEKYGIIIMSGFLPRTPSGGNDNDTHIALRSEK